MRIGDLRKRVFEEFGLDISLERLRRYHKLGLYQVRRGKSNFREYDEILYKKVLYIILLTEIGVGLDFIKNNSTKEIEKRVVSVRKVVERLREYEKVS